MSAAVQGGAVLRRKRPITLILVVIGVTVALTAIDSSLEKTEEMETRNEAQRDYQNGVKLLQQGNAEQAIDALRNAQALERDNLNYEVELITALMAAHKITEAEPLMSDVLQEESNDGKANLVAARLATAQHKIDEASAYYHRAIYGAWPDDALAHRTAARLELIHFLIANNRRHELLAELLPLQEEAGNDPKIQAQLGNLFLLAGSPSRAADVFREQIRAYPDNAAGYSGLGEAELALGEFHAAHNDFAAAALRDPKDPAIQQNLDLSTTLTALDPTPRWLSSTEKYRRSLHILKSVLSDLQQCMSNNAELANNATNQSLITNVGSMVSKKLPSHPTNEAAEDLLGMAEEMWKIEVKACGPRNDAGDKALQLVMEKLSQ